MLPSSISLPLISPASWIDDFLCLVSTAFRLCRSRRRLRRLRRRLRLAPSSCLSSATSSYFVLMALRSLSFMTSRIFFVAHVVNDSRLPFPSNPPLWISEVHLHMTTQTTPAINPCYCIYASISFVNMQTFLTSLLVRHAQSFVLRKWRTWVCSAYARPILGLCSAYARPMLGFISLRQMALKPRLTTIDEVNILQSSLIVYFINPLLSSCTGETRLSERGRYRVHEIARQNNGRSF